MKENIQIRKATIADAKSIKEIAIPAFLFAHEVSAPKSEIDFFIANNYQLHHFKNELQNLAYEYNLIAFDGLIAGYSKLVLNNTDSKSKLDRFYIQEKYHGLGLAKKLLDFNITLAKENNQTAVQLFTWVENKRAIAFYAKNGFEIVGSFDFPISPNHKNPNHLMELSLIF